MQKTAEKISPARYLDLDPGRATVGIDPGLGGALAVLTRTEVLGVADMPTQPRTSGRGRQVDAGALAGVLRLWVDRYRVALVRVEAVHAHPAQGVTGVFSFGYSAGVVAGVLAALRPAFRPPVSYVTPVVWKAAAGLSGRGKEAAVGRVLEIYPEASTWLTLKKHTGRADAILLAWTWARLGVPPE